MSAIAHHTHFLSRQQWTGVAVSIALHLLLLMGAGAVLIKPVQYAVETGVSGIEVELVAAPVEEVIPQPKEIIPEPNPVNPIKVEEKPVVKQEVKPVPKIEDKPGKDKVTLHSKGGAIVEAKPQYLSNPAPPYPWEARRKGWEGTTFLKVAVSKTGTPTNIQIEQTSGHAILDEAAQKVVWKWHFAPATLGNVPVESTVRIPVRFALEKNKR